MKNNLLFLILLFCFCSCRDKQKEASTPIPKKKTIENPSNKIGLSNDIEFIALNPARGDQSPQAGAIYGNIREAVPTGYIGKFVDGFSSPPHIHNVTYRAIVMNGSIHNDDPQASKMWMPPGSFWTQPKGEVHITAAKGENTMAYIEIDDGPYLVKSTDEAFDSGERPINIDISNMIWLGSAETRLITNDTKAELAFLWENDKGAKGYLLKLPTGFKGTIHSNGDVFYGIIIQGSVIYKMPIQEEVNTLDQGSHFESKTEAIHDIEATEESLIYIRTNESFVIK